MTPRQSRSRTANIRGPDSILKNAASSFVAQMTTASLTAVLTLFLVRALGAKQYGLFAVAIGVSAIAMAFADVGISSSTARFVAEHRGRDTELPALIADALKMKVVITGLACALLAALASVIAGVYGNSELVWPLRGIALATFGQSTFLMLGWVATALGRAVVNVRLTAVESLLEISASVALILAGAGVAGAAFGRAFGYVLGAVVAACVVLRLSGHGWVGFWRLPRRATVRRVGMYAGSTFAIDASYTLSSSLSVLLLGAYAGAAASGIFQAPAKLIVLIQYVGLSTANGVAPRLARGPGQQPTARALDRALRVLIAFQCLMLAPAVVWAGPIAHVLLGAGYSQSADVLRALAPYIFFCGLAPLVTSGVTFLGEAGRRVPISLATLALTAAGGLILIPSHGVVGAAIATDVAFGFYTLAHIWLCRRLLQLRIGRLLWSLACGLTAAAAMGIVLASIGTKHLTLSDWLKGGVGGLATYIAMLIFTREIPVADTARVITTMSGLLARKRLAPSARRSPWPTTPPLRAEATVATEIPAALGADASPGMPPTAPERTGTRKGPRRRCVRTSRPDRVTERTRVSTEAADSTDAARAGSSASNHAGSAMNPLPVARSQPRIRDRLGARAGAAARALGAVLGSTRDLPIIAHLQFPSGLGFLTTHARGSRSPAAAPPSWLEGVVPNPGELIGPGALQRSPAAEPPSWLAERLTGEPAGRPAPGHPASPDIVSAALPHGRARDHSHAAPLADAGGRGTPTAADDRDAERRLAAAPPTPDRLKQLDLRIEVPGANVSSSARAGEDSSAAVSHARQQSHASDEAPDTLVGSRSSADVVYQIAWRLEDGTGVFELLPAELSDSGDTTSGIPFPIEPSPPVPWGWRMAPAPTPEARRAHAALVDRLLAAGWRRAGTGDTWFAHQFRSPRS
jgi:O-antigen/teichoic acid export membrane protein